MFVYIDFNAPPTRITVLVRNVSDERFIDMEQSLCLLVCFCFYQLGLCSVSYTANECTIYRFSIIIESFLISLSQSDYCPRL